MGNKRSPFKPDTVYHIYNHGNAEDNIFREEENYHYFLKRYAHYIYPVARTYAFCLMPNHFHFMVGIREEGELAGYFESTGKDLIGFQNLSGLVSRQFSNFLNAYTKAFNKRYNRKGKLFLKSLNRKPVEDHTYYTRLITYIHQNPVHHGFVKEPPEWPFSSYHLFVSGKKTRLERQKVLGWFGGRKAFLEFHEENQEIEEEMFY